MINNLLMQFAAAEGERASGLGALGINVQSFLFQLITFILVLLLLRKFVYSRLIDTLEARRTAVIDSLEQAKKIAKELEDTNHKTAQMIKEARAEADDVIATGQKEATAIIDAANHKAVAQTKHILSEAETRIQGEVRAARQAIKAETIGLVAHATEMIIKEKLDPKKDSELIAEAINGAKE